MLSGGKVRCWGDNSWGQLGNGATTNEPTPTPVAVTGVTAASGISTGKGHTCARLRGATVQCWGNNSYGQLGNGTTTNSPTAVVVTDITTDNAVSANGDHSCARLTGGTIKCWGYNRSGQLGNGTLTDDPTPAPVAVSGITKATALSAGGDDRYYESHACALLRTGTIKCWGSNRQAQLGVATFSATPVNVAST